MRLIGLYFIFCRLSKIHKSEEKDNSEQDHNETAESCTANRCHSKQNSAVRLHLPQSLEYSEPTSTSSIVDSDTTRLSQTCPPYFYRTQLPSTLPAVLQKRSVTENPTDFRHQQRNHIKQIRCLHLTKSRRYEGRVNLISALRRCSNIAGDCSKISLYNNIKRKSLLLLLLFNAIILNC